MDELTKLVNDPAGAESVLNAGLAAKLRNEGDAAYCTYAAILRRNECLGWEQKVKSGKFGKPELDALMLASEHLGRHKAMCEAAIMAANVK